MALSSLLLHLLATYVGGNYLDEFRSSVGPCLPLDHALYDTSFVGEVLPILVEISGGTL